MPLALVDNQGTVLDYEDSRAPVGSTDYTTLVMFHGIYFNSGTSSHFVDVVSYA